MADHDPVESEPSRSDGSSASATHSSGGAGRFTRRGLLTGAGATAAGLVVGAGGGWAVRERIAPAGPPSADAVVTGDETVAFYGRRQAAVEAPAPAHIGYLGFTLRPETGVEQLRRALRIISDDASRLTRGVPSLAMSDPDLATPAARLTVTIGFGARVFELAGRTPPPGVGGLPAFSIDRLRPEFSGGDLLLMIGSDDPITLSHTERVMIKNMRFFATVAWRQQGFQRARHSEPQTATPRNLFGQKDGTVNPRPDTDAFEQQVWGASGGFAPWTENGTTLVLRRIRMNLETWDEVDPVGRENSVGRRLGSGAPLTGTDEFDEPDFDAKNSVGFPVIDLAAHMRRARQADGRVRILRRGYSYDDGVDAEGVADVGLLFGAWQADIMQQFVPVQQSLADMDLLNQWTVPIGSATFAIPPGCDVGGYVGETVLD
ncbi:MULTISPECIES: Dyp-type peroxidase [unclassified Pseudoclavibacter]|uniref:Dyp-type peroxidase n=1 Tax=unclassified Pseudoclavibacter TaxID=2615177 RepID=UPI0013015CF0|nr:MULTISPECIES: Dyp-type peroxidase [unclassified Pseudoclavibacter]KAB1646331.1 Dyp-type peroxidase [Pseudoclavibacter sp. CFCC 14310]KAB1663507.1 Dyp-type peroxidase [Pseudoclavibacter sp. CFCC 13611]